MFTFPRKTNGHVKKWHPKEPPFLRLHRDGLFLRHIFTQTSRLCVSSHVDRRCTTAPECIGTPDRGSAAKNCVSCSRTRPPLRPRRRGEALEVLQQSPTSMPPFPPALVHSLFSPSVIALASSLSPTCPTETACLGWPETNGRE